MLVVPRPVTPPIAASTPAAEEGLAAFTPPLFPSPPRFSEDARASFPFSPLSPDSQQLLDDLINTELDARALDGVGEDSIDLDMAVDFENFEVLETGMLTATPPPRPASVPCAQPPGMATPEPIWEHRYNRLRNRTLEHSMRARNAVTAAAKELLDLADLMEEEEQDLFFPFTSTGAVSRAASALRNATLT